MSVHPTDPQVITRIETNYRIKNPQDNNLERSTFIRLSNYVKKKKPVATLRKHVCGGIHEPAILTVLRPFSTHVDPGLYFHAAGEIYFLLLTGSWLLTFLFRPDVISDNPILDRLGYNNICVGFDEPPAVYYAAPLFCWMVYLVVRYAVLDTTRAFLQRDLREVNQHQFKFTLVANSVYSASAIILPMLFLINPETSNWGHLGLFQQYVIVNFFAVAANFYEAEALTRSQRIFLVWFGAASAGLCIMTAFGYYDYESQHDENGNITNPSGTFEHAVNWWIDSQHRR
jgi:hypothetical protein